ncbi:hypothetical protein BKA70DRAFT_1251883 [Coprinopsis sp. MPI-PUGE-AT-0042]|nr:hypothetical protein BKA70DRAFT_1251883 [Coprinopsis sp. MPI-PUGE-AT-0042]
MQLFHFFAAVALFTSAASAAPYDSGTDARAVVRSLTADYEGYRLVTRGECSVSGNACRGYVQIACGVICTGSPCAFSDTTPASRELLTICREKCSCGSTES